MQEPAATQGQVYLSEWPKRLVTSRLLPRPLLLAITRGVAGLMRRRIRRQDRLEAITVPLPAADHKPVLYFADIYHGGVTFWDWVLLRGGGLWWNLIWPLVLKTSVERLQTHHELRTVLELDAQTFEELAQRRHADLATLRQIIALGRMEIVNGTYAQPLAQTIGAEANLRHFFYGLDAIERVLDTKVKSFVAGEPQFFPQLPQVLVGFGIENVVFRTHWAPFGTDPAADAAVVRWHGPDGSAVRAVPRYGCMDYRLLLANHPGVQNAGLTGDDFEQWSAERLDEFAAGTARRGIHRPLVTRLADPKPPESPFPSILGAARRPGSHLVTVQEYFDMPQEDERRIAYTIDDIPNTIPWGLAGEQLHREQARTESALLCAERLDAIVQALGAPGQQASLDTAWKLLLRSQHHDLHLCSPWHSTAHGTSMGEVGGDFARQSRGRAETIAAAAMATLAERFRPAAVTGRACVLFNPSPWPRRELVQLPARDGATQVWQGGTRLTTQTTSDSEGGAAVGCVVELPPFGVDTVELRISRDRAPVDHAPSALTPDEDVIARELGSGQVHGGYLTVWKDGRLCRSTVERLRIEQDGPVFRRYRLDGRLADLSFVQWITMIPALHRIQLVTEIDFGSEQHLGPQLVDHRPEVAYYVQDEKKLCLNFESALPTVFCDSPFLLVEPTGPRMTAASLLGVQKNNRDGVAILHKGTPGWHVDRQSGVLRNVLAWAPERWLYASDDSITPGSSRYTAVRGVHRFEHAIVAIGGRPDAIRAAQNFRLPVMAADVPSGKAGDRVPWSFLETAPLPVMLTALFARNGQTYARLWNVGNVVVDIGWSSGIPVSFRLEEAAHSGWPSIRPWAIETVRLDLRRPPPRP